MKIRVLLADDHKIIRQVLVSFLNQQSEIEIIGQAEDGRYAVELAKELQPDIFITDINMPNLSGIDATYEITRQNPSVKIIALSGQIHEYFVAEMLEAGASAYVLKECLFDELLEAIDTVRKDKIYLCPRIGGIIVSNYIKMLSASDNNILDTLSSTEQKLLNLIIEGKLDKQIINELQEDTDSIEAIKINLMEKLNINNAKELVKIALSR